MTSPSRLNPEKFRRGSDKIRGRIPINVAPAETPKRKPAWIRAKAHNHPKVGQIKKLMRDLKLSSVCEEAACPNLGECFAHGTATFMILGSICTRRCPFCDVATGRPDAPDVNEPQNLAEAVGKMGLSYVVITSVDRDDLPDGGAKHFTDCIGALRVTSPNTQIEVLVPDFRGRMDLALEALMVSPPDVFNHNLETVPRLYKQCRPGSNYAWSLKLLQEHHKAQPDVPSKSGLMLGLGEKNDEVLEVMEDMRAHDIDMLTLGQYLQPSMSHHPVDRFVTPDEFDMFAEKGRAMGFTHVASGPMVRSSYHADRQAAGVLDKSSNG
ncbi:MAG TPA: lipoyl synthase [Gammaproteobacteria bacterium]|nr:lipoyl synthase [Gammaproteobacteria bacterium]